MVTLREIYAECERLKLTAARSANAKSAIYKSSIPYSPSSGLRTSESGFVIDQHCKKELWHSNDEEGSCNLRDDGPILVLTELGTTKKGKDQATSKIIDSIELYEFPHSVSEFSIDGFP